jgi:hypothetical protein
MQSAAQKFVLLSSLLCASVHLCAQEPATLVPSQVPNQASNELPTHTTYAATRIAERGTLTVNGKSTPYLIRRLPITTFPDLPSPIAAELTRRSCMIPQSYQAHRPENVIHGSFESPTSSDWAVLCSTGSRVTLLVFFSSTAASPIILDEADEKSLLQPHDLTGILGFNWGIDAATPAAVHQAQAALDHRPTPPTHDSVALSWLEHRTTYRLYEKGHWTELEMP